MKHLASQAKQRGYALLLVLIIVSFAAVIAVMFLLSAGQERSGTNAYAQGSAVRQLASQAVNIVIGQINAATREGTMSTPVSWASQPGMIRTYNTQGGLSNAYKLYSWNNMIEAGSKFIPADTSELPDSTWTTKPAQYTDINQPVNQVYPIVDPSVLDTQTSGTFTANSNGIQWDFLGEAGLLKGAAGYYPSTINQAPMPVQWLYILQDGTWTTPSAVNGNNATIPNASASNPIVGRIAFWTDDETAKVNVNTAGEGSYWDTPKAGTADELQFAGNPPLQDEFQRLSGHPATTSLSAVFPEILGGSTAFSRWASGGGVNNSYQAALQAIYGYGASGSSTSHGLNPRLSWGTSSTSGGSQGGTFPISNYLATYAPQLSTYFPNGYTAPSTYAVTPNTDRLYATAADAYFQPVWQSGTTTRTGTTAFSLYNITAKSLSQRLFFLTADSNAPETTLYETPRVSMWPITWPYKTASYYVSINRTTPPKPTTLTPGPSSLSSNTFMAYQEKLLAFCSSLNAGNATSSNIYPYYFQRQDPDSSIYDWNNISRNRSLVSYLANELSDPNSSSPYSSAPGIGASLGSKWDTDKAGTTDWITLNCFDYIRSMINQYTLNPTPTGTFASQQLLYGYTALNYGSTLGYSEPNSFTVAPLNVTLNGNQYATEGTYPALREAALVFYATQRNVPKFNKLGTPASTTKLYDVQNPDNWSNLISWNGTTGNSQTTHMRMVMLLNFSQMSPGIAGNTTQSTGNVYSVYHPVFWVKVSTPAGSSQFQVNGSSINFPLSGGNVVQINPIGTGPAATSPSYAAALFASGSSTSATAKTFNNTLSGTSNWSLISDDISLGTPGGATSFVFTGSKIQIDVYPIDSSGNINIDPTLSGTISPVYSYKLDFSAYNSRNTFGLGNGVFPTPIAPYWNVRQSPVLATVSGTTAVASSSTATVTGGVLMPFYTNSGSLSTSTNWQTEIVPVIGQLTGLASQWTSPRTGGSSNLNGGDTFSTEPLMYVYQDSGTGTYTFTDGSKNYTSLDFSKRVAALPLYKNTTPSNGITALGLDNPSYSGLTLSGTGQLLFSGSQQYTGLQGYQLVTPYDTVVSLVADPTVASAGDPRLIGRGISGASGTFSPIDQVCSSSKPLNPITPISALPNFGTATGLSTYQAQYHALGTTGAFPQITGILPPWQFGTTGTVAMATRGGRTDTTGLLMGTDDPSAGLGIESTVLMSINPNWDWTRLPGTFADGGYLLRPDQEYQSVVPKVSKTATTMNVPYFGEAGLIATYSGTSTSAGFFSPNRQVPSPVIFGTLPDSMTTGWQTLNFCPNPAITMNSSTTHPGLGAANSPSATGAAYSKAPDHLLLDLFWMPVAEPYPISEEFATAGKVNLNYAMMPFPYIQRKTALDALLKSVWITAMPSPSVSANFPAYYKSYGLLYQKSLDKTHTRYPVNVDATLRAFDYKFQQGDIFRVASQICDMYLYPNDPTTPNTLWAGNGTSSGISGFDTAPSTTNIKAWWAANSFTADNERESPYNAIYSRVTTKSNTYTVHWRVQTLRKTPGTPGVWIEGTDKITSELRGSSLIERYLDPGSTLPDYATNTATTIKPMSYYYKWRVDSENYFQP